MRIAVIGLAVVMVALVCQSAMAQVRASVVKSFGPGFIAPTGMASDSAGNIYVANGDGNVLKETYVPATQTYTESAIYSNSNGYPVRGIAVSADGTTIYLGINNAVDLITGSGTTYSLQTAAIFSGFNSPPSLALDAAGNVYVLDQQGALYVETLSGGAFTQTQIVGNGTASLGVAVDLQGNIYVTQYSPSSVVKYTLSGGTYTASTIADGNNAGGGYFFYPQGISVDASGAVYFSAVYYGIFKLLPGSGGSYNVTQIYQNNQLGALAVDPAGNVFFGSEYGTNPGTELQSIEKFGSVAVGSSTQATIAFAAQGYTYPASTVGLLKGASGQDFAISGNCSGFFYYDQGCQETLTFTPKQPGVRNGAVQLLDNVGNILASINVTGTGIGGQAIFSPSTITTVASGIGIPSGVAIDGAGNAYAADFSGKAVNKYPAGGGSGVAIPAPTGGYSYPSDVALDGAGNVYVADSGNHQIVTITPNGTVGTIGTGFNKPFGLAVDGNGNGNVYVTDLDAGTLTEIKAGAVPQQIVLATGLNQPNHIALDTAGNVYVTAGGVVEMVPAGGGTPTAVTFSGYTFYDARGIALDAAGNLYVTDDLAIVERKALDNSVVTFVLPSHDINESLA
ncbi:MAG: hypothetical protein ABI064_07945, partial [Acidobacteriaceae bacterium]